ncbi:hypothetical protein [Phenylobacterium sp.]|jgi:hypothetical protein|uniref:hypothetical protein n=1 Tax=Phenylobacterium sp. TaxID=1871053 RepID=UPI002F94F2A6
MTAANLAYLLMILGAYALFVLVLGAYWVRSAFAARKPAEKIVITRAKEPAPAEPARKRAA